MIVSPPVDFPRGVVAALVAAGLLAARPTAARAGAALEELRGVAGEMAVRVSVAPRAPVLAVREPEPSLAGSTFAPVPVALRNSILLPPAGADADHDGLSDAAEGELADAFRPLMVFDSRERPRRAGEPVVVFQVRPEGCVGARAVRRRAAQSAHRL